MNRIPTLPENAPFSVEQRAWINGFLAGLLADRAESNRPSATGTASPNVPLLVAYGSQTGTAETLARRLAKDASQHGCRSSVQELNAVTPNTLAQCSHLLIVTSTWGDGDPPDNASQFWSWLSADSAPRCPHLQFAVLALGDRNYTDFCGAGKKFDARLADLGAQRLLPMAECDLEYQATAASWAEKLWAPLTSAAAPSPTPNKSEESAPPNRLPAPTEPSNPPPATRQQPHLARLKTNRRLSGLRSNKDTRHFEIALADSSFTYEPGDALGVFPKNDPVLVEELLAILGWSGDETVTRPQEPGKPIHDILLSDVVITQAGPTLVRWVADRSPAPPEIRSLLEPDRTADLNAWLQGRDLVDVLRACPGTSLEPAELLGQLRRLQPRLYSISSSLRAHPGEVHLTVAAVRYEAHGRARKGVASCWLADRVALDETPVPVFIQKSHGFRLPTQGDVPIIMVGPGTGVAPFRSFLEERQALGAPGRHWLFFGDQSSTDDFLYQDELRRWQEQGLLTRLDLAFSRDQPEKIYVQHRMQEQAQELWRWLNEGAHFYVCGDAKRMAKDVDLALRDVCRRAGGLTEAQADEFVAQLKQQNRYQRDVY